MLFTTTNRLFYLYFLAINIKAEFHTPFQDELDNKTHTVHAFCSNKSCNMNEMNGEFEFMTDNCCLQCSWDSGPENKGYRCVKTSKRNLNLSPEGKGHYMYSLIQHCPISENQTKNGNGVTKCLYPNDEHFDEIIPIYSRTTGRHYRNIHCSRCNKDHSNIIPWETEIICNDILELFFAQSSIKLISMLENISLLKWNPPSETARVCVDNRYLISKCPNYGIVHKFRDICSEVYAPVIGLKGMYKNAFCLACNENVDTCFLRKNTIKATQNMVSVIVNSALISAETKENANFHILGRCQSGKVFDNLLNDCIEKVCPFGKMKVGNSCKPFILKISGASLSYHLRFLYKTTTPSTTKVLTLARHFVLHHNETPSAICDELNMGVAMEDDFIAVNVKLIKNFRESTSIFEDFTMLMNKISYYNSVEKKEDFPLRVEINENVIYTPVLGSILRQFLTTEGTPACPYAIAITSIQFCDLVKIKTNPCENGIITMENGVIFQRWENVELFTESESLEHVVCYDKYVSRMKMHGGASGIDQLNVMYGMKFYEIVVILTLIKSWTFYFF